MTMKTKQERISEAITLTTAILVIAAICLLAMKLTGIAAQTAVEYRLSEM